MLIIPFFLLGNDSDLDLDLHDGDVKPYLDTQGNIIQFVDGSRGRRQLNINNQIFNKMSVCADVAYWR